MSDNKDNSSTPQKPKRQDLIVKRFGKLTVLEYTKDSKGVAKWKCLCGCVKREIDEQRDFNEILTYTDNTCIEFLKDISIIGTVLLASLK